MGARHILLAVGLVGAVWTGCATSASAGFNEDKEICIRPKPLEFDQAIDACNRQIQSGRWKGRDLSIMLRNLGFRQLDRFRKDRKTPDYDAAIASFTKAYNNDPTYLDALVTRAKAYETKPDYGKSIEDYGAVLLRQPGNVDAHFSRGRAYSLTKDYLKAIGDFNDCIALQPTNQFAFIWRGEAWVSQGNDEAALHDFDEALKLAPTNSAALGDRANIYVKKGLIDRALDDLNAAIKASAPNVYYATYEKRGDLLLKKSDYSGAIEDYTRAIGGAGLWKRFPTLKRADAYMASGDTERALADYDAANKTLFGDDAKFLRARVARGLALEKTGNRQASLEDLKFALTLQPKDDEDRKAFETAQDHVRKLEASNSIGSLDATNAEAKSDPSGSETAVALLDSPAAFVPSGPPDRRIALVIGNSRYQNVPALPNPANDASLVAETLKQIGFSKVDLAVDLGKEALLAKLQDFAKQSENADWAMVYYAGHGMEVGGINYLIPVDAKLAVDRDIQFEAVPLEQVLNAAERAKKLRLVIMDACRDNPFASQMKRTLSASTRSVARGLVAVEPDAGTLVAFSAKDGETSMDGDGTNSPFTTAFVKNVRQPRLEIRRLFDLVRDDVLEATDRRQRPFTYGSLSGKQNFYFVAAAKN
jgi:tetratricopeptide (TPR) repeat protein